MSDDLIAWLALLLAGATGGPLVAWGLGWIGPSESSVPAVRRALRPAPRRKLRLAGALLVLVAGLGFPPVNCVQKAAAADGLASGRSGVRTWSRPPSSRGGPCQTRPCP